MLPTNPSFIVTSPEQMNSTFAHAYNSGDIENLLALYEPDACLVSQTGAPNIGLAAIRTFLLDFLQLKGQMTSTNQYAYISGEIALLRAKFHLIGTLPGGEPIEMQGTTAEVVRRQPDGRWLYIIDHPFGGEG